MKHPICIALVLAPLVSCTAVSERGPSVPDLRAGLDAVVLVPPSLDPAVAPAPSATGPLRIGIAPPLFSSARGPDVFGPQVARGRAEGIDFDVWTDAEREVIDGWCARAEAAGLLAHFEYLPGVIIDPDQPSPAAGIRAAALSRGLDAVLVTRIGTTYWADPTVLSILDAALVTALFVPTADFTTVALVEGALVDAHTGHVYATGTAESTRGKLAPPLGADVITYQRRARLDGVRLAAARLAAQQGLAPESSGKSAPR